jgi:hypothetical protein
MTPAATPWLNPGRGELDPANAVGQRRREGLRVMLHPDEGVRRVQGGGLATSRPHGLQHPAHGLRTNVYGATREGHHPVILLAPASSGASARVAW